MEKRILIRIIFEKLTLASAAELEEKIEEILEEYGPHTVEITAHTSPVFPARPA